MHYAPGGVDALVLPWVRAALGVPWRSVVWQVEVSFAGPSAFGDAGSATLGAVEVSLGAGASLPLARALRVEAGARVSFFALRLALANAPPTDRVVAVGIGRGGAHERERRHLLDVGGRHRARPSVWATGPRRLTLSAYFL